MSKKAKATLITGGILVINAALIRLAIEAPETCGALIIALAGTILVMGTWIIIYRALN